MNKEGAGPWDCYWYFNGTDAYITTPHNADFDTADGGDSTVLLGFEDQHTGSVTYYLVSKTRGTTDANDGDFSVRLNKSGTPDTFNYYHRVGGGHNWKGVAVNYTDNERTVASGQRESSLTRVLAVLDSASNDEQNSTNTFSGNQWHGTDDLWIGATRNSVLTPMNHFQGRLYFFYWIKGVRIGWSWGPEILNETSFPWETYDPDTYPQCYINFCQNVGATLIPNMQTGPNAPYTFTIFGNPVLNGP